MVDQEPFLVQGGTFADPAFLRATPDRRSTHPISPAESRLGGFTRYD